MPQLSTQVRTAQTPQGRSVTVCKLTGVVDNNTLTEFEEAMDAIQVKGERNLIVECEGIDYVNSSGLGLMLKYTDYYRSNNGRMVLAKVGSKFMMVLEILGFIPLFNFCADEAESMRQIDDFHTKGGDAGLSSSAMPASATSAKIDPAPAPAAAASPIIQTEGSIYSDLPRQNLCALIARERDLLDDPIRLEGYLKKYCSEGEGTKEIEAIVGAQRKRVPADLRNASPALPFDQLSVRLQERVQQELSIPESLAKWTIETWAIALGLAQPANALGAAAADAHTPGAQLSVPLPSESSAAVRVVEEVEEIAEFTPPPKPVEPKPKSPTPKAPGFNKAVVKDSPTPAPTASPVAKYAKPEPKGPPPTWEPKEHSAAASSSESVPKKKGGCMGVLLTVALMIAWALSR